MSNHISIMFGASVVQIAVDLLGCAVCVCVCVCAMCSNNAKALTEPTPHGTSATLPQPPIRPVERFTYMFAQLVPPKAM
jgi:hypothetical protein